MSLIPNGLLRFDGYEIDRAQWRLSWHDEPLQLNRKTFDLLLYLVDHADRVVGKDELLRTLWPESFVEESNLTQHIFLLRKALSRHASGTKIIETVPGRGYRFTAVIATEPPQTADRMVIRASETITRITLEEEEADTPESAVAPGAQRALPPPHQQGQRILWLAGAIVAVAILGFAGRLGWQRWLDHVGGPPVEVVLTPFEGTTGDPILDRSLTNALRMDLSQSPHVSVLPAATVSSTLVQMTHKADDPITAAMAREICERTNSQAVLHGFIARSGQHYLLTEEASNCVDGGVIAEAKHEATQADDLPHSIDVLAESLRQRLGESRSSIRRFNTPLFQGDNTVSLDALKAYTQGSEALRLGDISDAISLLKTSVAADPNFAAGWYGLYAAYASAGDDVDARAAVTQAYRLKDTASRLMQFHINSAFIQTNTQDLYESLRNVEAWAALYPNSYVALNTLSNVQRDLARYSDAVRSSQRAMAISPENAAINIDLITGQIQSGDLSAARSGCDQAVIKHLDGDGLRIRCLELAYVLHEPGFMEAQKAWYAAHPEAPTVTLGLTRIAISEGRFNDARRLAAKTSELFHEQGVGGAGDHFKKSLAVEMMESGDVEAGERLFRSTPIDPEEGQDLLGLVYEGDVAGAKSALHAMQSKYPKGTLWNLYYGPQIRAAVAMAERNPEQAAAILEEARPIEMRELVVPWMRGVAHLGAGKPALAEKEFRQVVTHPEVDPTSCEIPLSWLGLGRALAAQGNRPAARDAYQHFLALWAHADPDAKFLVEARNELKALQASEPVHGSLGKREGSR